ncbi:MAG: HlyD family efflux transporter periplasmic adaptor subunit [Myxococcales bacterium]|nr:HlyD family efflux transporter periplasmic adaptor subunit [Myxococcales bacterium]
METAARVARASLASRKASLDERKAELAQFQVVAPYDGVTAARLVDPGDWVTPGDPVLEVVSTSDLEVIVDGSKVLAGQVAEGDDVVIFTGGLQRSWSSRRFRSCARSRESNGPSPRGPRHGKRSPQSPGTRPKSGSMFGSMKKGSWSRRMRSS